jgi:hypothetical protein
MLQITKCKCGGASQQSLFMVNYLVCAVLLIAVAFAAMAEERRPPGAAQAQQKRAAVRAAVQTKTDEGVPASNAANSGRKLSPAQRSELRQQLRQQRP